MLADGNFPSVGRSLGFAGRERNGGVWSWFAESRVGDDE